MASPSLFAAAMPRVGRGKQVPASETRSRRRSAACLAVLGRCVAWASRMGGSVRGGRVGAILDKGRRLPLTWDSAGTSVLLCCPLASPRWLV